MGISGWESGAGRNARAGADPGVDGRAWDHGDGSLPGALHLRLAPVCGFSPADATVSLPALEGNSGAARACGAEMGDAPGPFSLSHARSGFAAYTGAARSALARLPRDTGGATAIE